MKRTKRVIRIATDPKDLAPLLKSDDWKVRFIAEYWELKFRYFKLREMVQKYDARTLDFKPKCKIGTLKQQLRTMGKYLYVLEVRAKVENINLHEEYIYDLDLMDRLFEGNVKEGDI